MRNRSCHAASSGVLVGSITLHPMIFPTAPNHPRYPPSTASTNPMPSPPKKGFFPSSVHSLNTPDIKYLSQLYLSLKNNIQYASPYRV
ncbi:hypothetical protein BDA96_05G138900 [Sorghum bicolor]|uniref:Uncharacterized protein n=2 Tax=Sorghum bicolor TaxID=4558 RepID=A0A921QX91_SORBI|nr:hypothetical protein BDA96_05G138900 [Sorghum bicolor]KXG28472.1 hypothetical protein SORBI_3005G126900 [Sorghum bicolor]